MLIENGVTIPLIRIKTPDGINFLQQHQNIIESTGYVWFCRFGKNNMRLDTVINEGSLLIIKESGPIDSHFYLAQYSEITELEKAITTEYPSYYNSITQQKSLWFKITSIITISFDDVESNFVVASTNGEIKNILRSMCPAFYVKCIKKVNL